MEKKSMKKGSKTKAKISTNKKKAKTNKSNYIKYALIGVVLVIIVGVAIFIYLKTMGSNQYKLKQLGYNEAETKEIMAKTNQGNMNYLYKNGYVKMVPELIKNKDYKKKNFNKYLDYLSKNKDASASDLIVIVNSGADKYEYNEFLMNILTSEDFKFKNLDKYMDYSSNNKEASYDDVIVLINLNITIAHSEMLVNIAKEDYFIYDRLERYINYSNSHSNLGSKDVVTNVNANIDRDFYTDIETTDVNKNELMIVNKYYKLPYEYTNYGELVTMDLAYSNKNGQQLSKVAYEAFKILVDDAEKEGYYIRNNSAYRSYFTQEYTYNGYVSSNGFDWAESWSARPGHSEHQTGLALDVGKAGDYVLGNFEYTGEYQWMLKNAYKYGFILRYPKGKEYITGYNDEPWHYRYVGKDVAKYIYEHDITYEEYYAYFLNK